MATISTVVALGVYAIISVPSVEGLQPLLNVSGCGKSNVLEQRVRGGRPVRLGEMPWVVRISIRSRGICTGTIITPQHVISAAHCKAPSPGDYTVYYGHVEWNLAKTSKVINHFISPETENRQPINRIPFEDVLILQLERPISFDKSTSAICIADKLTENLVGKEIQMAGYGATDMRQPASHVLRQAGTVVLGNMAPACKRIMIYGPKYEICTFNHHKATCLGDSGGPLMLKRGGIYYQLGTASYSWVDRPSDWCPGKNTPDFFARISAVRDFIVKTLKANGGKQYIAG